MDWVHLVLKCLCNKQSVPHFFLNVNSYYRDMYLSAGDSCGNYKHSAEQNISFRSAGDCKTGLVLWRGIKARVQTIFIIKK